MAGNILWMSGTVQVLAMQLSGQGQQLTNGSAVALTNTLRNDGVSGGPGFFGLAELVCSASGFGAATNANTTIDLHLVPSRDATNFMDVDTAGAVLPANHYVGSFIVTVSGNSRMRLGVPNIPLLPVQYKGYIKNNTGQTLTSGWSLFIDLYQEAYT